MCSCTKSNKTQQHFDQHNDDCDNEVDDNDNEIDFDQDDNESLANESKTGNNINYFNTTHNNYNNNMIINQQQQLSSPLSSCSQSSSKSFASPTIAYVRTPHRHNNNNNNNNNNNRSHEAIDCPCNCYCYWQNNEFIRNPTSIDSFICETIYWQFKLPTQQRTSTIAMHKLLFFGNRLWRLTFANTAMCQDVFALTISSAEQLHVDCSLSMCATMHCKECIHKKNHYNNDDYYDNYCSDDNYNNNQQYSHNNNNLNNVCKDCVHEHNKHPLFFPSECASINRGFDSFVTAQQLNQLHSVQLTIVLSAAIDRSGSLRSI